MSKIGWVLILITSYFYCLPLGRFSFAGFESDLRIFDFVILVFWLANWKTLLAGIRFFLLKKRWPAYFVIVISFIIFFSIIFNIAFRGIGYLGPTLIRAYRFFGYWLTLPALLTMIRDLRDYRLLRTYFYFLILIMTVLSFLQGIGILPNFWPNYWLEMYGENPAPVATLSPHHLQISMVMFMGIVFSIAYFNSTSNLFFKAVYASFMIMMFIVPIMAGTRTFALVLAGFFVGILMLGRSNILQIVIAVSIGIGTLLVFLDSLELKSKTENIVESRFNERVREEYEKDKFKSLTMERSVIYRSIRQALVNNPYLLITGSGFQAAKVFIKGTGAHNNFLQFLVETGIVGFIYFLLFISSTLSSLYKSSKYFRETKFGVFSSYIFAGFVGIIFSMFAGETLYAQAATFTLPGQIMIFIGIGLIPYFNVSFQAR